MLTIFHQVFSFTVHNVPFTSVIIIEVVVVVFLFFVLILVFFNILTIDL